MIPFLLFLYLFVVCKAPKIIKSLIAEMLKPARELNNSDIVGTQAVEETNIVTRLAVSKVD